MPSELILYGGNCSVSKYSVCGDALDDGARVMAQNIAEIQVSFVIITSLFVCIGTGSWCPEPTCCSYCFDVKEVCVVRTEYRGDSGVVGPLDNVLVIIESTDFSSVCAYKNGQLKDKHSLFERCFMLIA